MSTSTIISQLNELTLSLSEAAKKVEDEVRMRKETQLERDWNISKKYRLDALYRIDIVAISVNTMDS